MRNRALKILIAHGYTDLVTPYDVSHYLVSQLRPIEGAAPIEVRVYRGGHMMYLRPPRARSCPATPAASTRKRRSRPLARSSQYRQPSGPPLPRALQEPSYQVLNSEQAVLERA